MGWPQIAWIVLSLIGMGIAIAKHGEPRPDYNFWSVLVSAAIELGLLYAGGFFK